MNREVPNLLSKSYSYVLSKLPETVQRKLTENELKDKRYIHEHWKSQGTDDQHSPENYLNQVGQSEFIFDILSPYAETSNELFEPGCNVGRNLNYFYDKGYTNLTGIEINPRAIEVLEEEYPDLNDNVDIYVSDIESKVKEFRTNKFDITFTSSVLKHIHPDCEFVFDELVRVTDNYILTLEDETDISPIHVPRNYKKIFTNRGCEQIHATSGSDFPESTGLPESYYARIFQT
jgi:SAM-dependent methyltransferase